MFDTNEKAEVLLKVNNIEVVYNHIILVLRGVSLNVYQGGITALLGGNGAGKSTVTKAFASKLGLIYLDTGGMYRAVTWLIQKENINFNHIIQF